MKEISLWKKQNKNVLNKQMHLRKIILTYKTLKFKNKKNQMSFKFSTILKLLLFKILKKPIVWFKFITTQNP